MAPSHKDLDLQFSSKSISRKFKIIHIFPLSYTYKSSPSCWQEVLSASL